MKNTFVKVLSFMMALTMIVGAFGAITVSAAECAHEAAGEALAVVAPTCDTAGYTRYLCKHCGEEYVDAASIVLPTGDHELVDVPETPATCASNKITAHKKCTKCTYTEGKQEVAGTKLPHYWLMDAGKEATCTEPGYTTKKCAVCLVEDKKAFVCTCEAATDTTGNVDCTCGPDEHKDGWYVVVPATGHTFQYAVTEDPTNCITGKVTITCEDCDYNNVVANKAEHVWKNMDLSTKADGTEFKAEVVKALGEIGKEFGDTCGDDYKKGEICIVCYETRNTEASSGTCATFTVVGAADGFEVTAKNYKPEFATVDGKTFEVGSVTKVAPTHVAAGWQLIFCEDCATYDVMTLEKEDHDYTGTGSSVIWKDAQGNKYPNTASTGVKAYDDKEYHTIAMTKYNVCSCGAEKAATGTDSTKAATKHNYDWKVGDVQMGKVVVAADCVNNGTITWNCKDCEGGDYVELNGLALGHTYGEWSYVDSYTCGDAPAEKQMVRSCTRKYGNDTCALDGCKDYKKADANKTHAYAASIKTAATCVANAEYEWKCSDCGDIGTKPENVTYPVSGPDANNHAVKATDTDRMVQENVVSKTCTTKQKDRFLCECGKTLDLEVGAAPAHLGSAISEWHDTAAGCNAVWGLVEGSTDKYELKSGACVATCKVYFLHDATCQAGGVTTAGTFCSVCKVDIAKPTKVGKDTNNHVAPGSDNGATKVDATCIEKAYETKYYSCCGGVKKVYTSAAVDANNHKNVVFVAKVLPTCTTNGTEAYYKCSDCKKLVKATKIGSGETEQDYQVATGSNVITAATSINKLSTNGKHDFTGTVEEGYKVPAKAETCTAKGNVEYIKCKNKDCTYIQVGTNVFVPTDGTAGSTTNPADGIWDEVEIAPHGDANKVRYSAYYVNVLKPTLTAPTCTEGAWIAPADVTVADAYVCSKCVIDQKPAEYWNNALGHRGTNGTTVLDKVAANAGADYDCTKPTYNIYSCAFCDYEYFNDFVATEITAHKWLDANNDGVREAATADIVAPGCSTPGKTTYRCQNAGCTYYEEEIGAPAKGHYVNLTTGEKAITFSCKNDAWKEFAGLACADCGIVVDEDNVEKYGHKIVTAHKDATCTADGYSIKYCADCNKTYYAVSSKPIDNNYEHSKSALREQTATAKVWFCNDCKQVWEEAIEAVVVNTYAVSADKVSAGDKFTVTLTASGKVDSFSSKDINVPYDASKLTLVGVTANADLAGLSAFAATKVVSGVNYVGVALVVANDAEGNAQKVTTSAEGTVLFTLEFQANKTASGNATVGGKTVAIAGVGNLNGDGIVTAEDAQAIFAKVGSNDAAADVNNDGIVNFADVAALATFAASGKTAKDYLVMVGEYDAIEAEVYALLDAGRLANHDAAISVINVNDALALIAKIETNLASAYATLGDNVTAAAVVAYYNAH